MSLRIIGGKFQNHILKTTKKLTTRPTTARLRKTVFDICQLYVQDSYFLDLFAGSGAMGIEAISRGCAFSGFIEKDLAAISCLQKNIHTLQLENVTEIFRGDVFYLLKKVKKSFDIVYIDPPYELFVKEKEKLLFLLQMLKDFSVLNKNATIFIERPKQKEKDCETFSSYKLVSQRKVSDTLLCQYIFID